MKRRALILGAVLVAVALGGCAVPKKSLVRQPPPVSPVVPVVQQTPPATETLPQVRLEIPQVDRGKEQAAETEMAATTYLSERIFVYGEKLERWKALDAQAVSSQLSETEAAEMVSCFRQLQQVMSGYSQLRAQLLQGSAVAGRGGWEEEMATLQRQDIEFLEEPCGLMLAEPPAEEVLPIAQEIGGELARFEAEIGLQSAAGAYEEVVRKWSEVPPDQQVWLPLSTRLAVAKALLALHQEEPAAEVYQQMVAQMTSNEEQPADLFSLRKVLADIYVAAGRYPAAALQYQQILDDFTTARQLEEWAKLHLSILERADDGADELKDYGAILRNYLGYVAERDGFSLLWQGEKFLTSYPYSAVAANVEMIMEKTSAAAGEWFNQFLAEVDRLSAEKRYSEALELLQSFPVDIVGADQLVVIQEKNESVLLAEAVERETERMGQLQDLQNRWNNGMLLANAKRYDEAIEVFAGLLDSEYAVRAEARIKELSLEAAKEERKKAADIFIRYTKTTDLESRKTLLLETRRVLRAILVNYPEVDIAAKVADNIRRVEEEMNLVDPGLLLQADVEEPARPLDGVDQVFAPTTPPAGAASPSLRVAPTAVGRPVAQ